MMTKPQTGTPATTDAQRVAYVSPATHIYREADGSYVLEAEMPGVGKSGIEMWVENGELTIQGHRKPLGEKGTAMLREIRDADYRRVFELDAEIDVGRIGAAIEQGILRITLPLAERVKPRVIKVA
jgi:HSP20 family protein